MLWKVFDTLRSKTLPLVFLKLIFRERGGGGERERETEKHWFFCSTYLCIHWLLPVCSLTRDQTCNLGISRWGSNQLSYLARVPVVSSSTGILYICLGIYIKHKSTYISLIQYLSLYDRWIMELLGFLFFPRFLMLYHAKFVD